MVSQKVAVQTSLLRRVIRFALVEDYGLGLERCLYCAWSSPFVSQEEARRLLDLSHAEHQEWQRQFRSAQQHEKRCVVTRLRTLLGLPNPRAVYVQSEKEAPDDRD